MKKRILSLLLILCMAVTLLPTAAFAEEATGTPGTPTEDSKEQQSTEPRTSSAGGTIYVDATTGDDTQEDVGTTAAKAYKTLEKAVTAAKSGDTIQLGEGNYTLYKVDSVGHTKGKDLTFVGQGADKTGWNIGAEVPDPANFGTEYNGDYSFDGAGTITFRDMTLRSGSTDYLGFIRADNTVVEDCIINGKTFYWGYTSAMFKDTTFNCPSRDYAIWTYSSPVMTFDNCTFYSSGKVINVYTDYGAGKQNITVNFKNCAVTNTGSSFLSKQVLNVNDSNMKDHKYILNISGNNTVSGVPYDKVTCSRLYGFGGKAGNNTGKLDVSIDSTPVWSESKMLTHEHSAGEQDNAFEVTYGDWIAGQDGKLHRTGTRICNYCGYSEDVEETKALFPVKLVIYRNGDTSKFYETFDLGNQPEGTDIDLSTIDINNYYTANYTGNYDFYGWYNDGRWNDYKANPTNPPAGLEKITVNGWTNLRCMVYDYENVVYFRSAEDLAAYQKDHSKTDGLLRTTPARFGSLLPTTDAPTPTREGYTFTFWSREGQSEDVTGQTVNGWTNLYANWEKNIYTVTYTDGVDGEEVFADQTYNVPFEDTTPEFDGTPTRDGYVFAGWNPAVAEKVTANVTYTAQWKEDKNHNGIADEDEEKYIVTYTDGVDGEEVFADQVYDNLLSGTATPAFNATPTRDGYVFAGWNPEVAEKVTANVTYTAQWKEDKNHNGSADEDEEKYIVTYTDGVDNEEVFADLVNGNLLSGTATPAFNGTPTRDGYVFTGWEPEVADTVTGNATYVAQWKARTDLSYTVHYYLKNTTKQVADDKTVDGQTFNADVTENAIRIRGYRVYGDSVKSITIGTGTNEIIFYYTRASRPSASSTSKPTLNTGDHYAYVMGYPDGTVRPNGSITRAEVSTILFRLLSDKTRDEYFTTESSFTDVKAGAWYNNSIATLEKAGVIVDTAKGGAFRPNEAITRAELAAMLAQFADAKPVKGVKFSDVSAEHWAYEAIAIAAKMGWIEGYPDGTFRPDATITRAEMMTLVNRALERVPSDEDHLLSKRAMLTFPDCTTRDWFYIAVQEATNSHSYERAATEKNGDEQWTALRDNRDWTKFEQ